MSFRQLQFSDWFEHSTPSVLLQTCPPLYLNSGSLAQLEKKVEAAAVVFKWTQTAAVLLEGHMQGVLASMVGLSGFSN